MTAAEVSELAPLPRSFYLPSAAEVAPLLLGHRLLCRHGRAWSGGIIVETEAYLSDDPASHSFRGETARNRSMWGPPGHAYVYQIYGFHFCFNAVCGPVGLAEAVLVRALEPCLGLPDMRERRGGLDDHQLASGPGKLCAALAIDRQHDGMDLCKLGAALRIAANPERAAYVAELGPIIATPRIGISQAAEWPLRFCLARSPHLSRAIKAPAAS